MFARSTDGGNTWGAAIRVNDDVNPAGDFHSQFFPWMAVDPIDGSINVVWYDDRLYNGFPASTLGAGGATRNGIDKVGAIISRGVGVSSWARL